MNVSTHAYAETMNRRSHRREDGLEGMPISALGLRDDVDEITCYGHPFTSEGWTCTRYAIAPCANRFEQRQICAQIVRLYAMSARWVANPLRSTPAPTEEEGDP